jgi:hypothetical protein
MFMACFRWHDEPITKLNDKLRWTNVQSATNCCNCCCSFEERKDSSNKIEIRYTIFPRENFLIPHKFVFNKIGANILQERQEHINKSQKMYLRFNKETAHGIIKLSKVHTQNWHKWGISSLCICISKLRVTKFKSMYPKQ